MNTQYENQGGLLVKSGTTECAGYIFNFEGRGAYGPNKVETPQGGPTQVEIDQHNSLLAQAERDHMVKTGVGLFYVNQDTVSQWVGWKASWCYIRKGYSYGFCRVETRWVWFMGPDGTKWYGVNKGNMDCFTGRRLKRQK